MREIKTAVELKRGYWSQPAMYYTPKMVDAIVASYGDKPATSGEAVYVLRERLLDLLSVLPMIGKYVS